MKKFSFAATLFLSGVISTSALAQNYYDPGFYQNNNYGHANYNGGNYGYPQNYGYYPQQTSQSTEHQQQNKSISVQNNIKKQRRGVGTISVGADYVMGYNKFTSNKVNFNNFLVGNSYDFDTKNFDDKSKAVSFNLGWRPFKYLGIEAYYLSSFDASKSEDVVSTYNLGAVIAKQEVSYKSYGIDLIGYYPINDYIELLASIGVGKYDVEGKFIIYGDNIAPGTPFNPKSQTLEDSVVAYRIGGGFQFWLSRHLAFRVTGRWTSLGGEFADYITEINMGVRYHF